MEKPEPNPHNPGPDDTTFVGEYLVDPSQVSPLQTLANALLKAVGDRRRFRAIYPEMGQE